MKHLVIYTDESVLSGTAHSGLGEVSDSLANAMTTDYRVSVVCADGKSHFTAATTVREKVSDTVRKCRLFGVDYYLVSRSKDFLADITATIDSLKPDIFHSFGKPELLESLSYRPSKAVYTIERACYVEGKENTLEGYDAITTVSEAAAKELLENGDALSEVLAKKPFRGITNGILHEVFSPEKGVFVQSKFTAEFQYGKTACKNRLLATYGIKGNPCLYLMMCRLEPIKGIDRVIEALPQIKANNGFVVFVGTGDKEYENKLSALSREDGALFVRKFASPVQTIPMLAGADFLFSPSKKESCGLMVMHACRYGTIPITTLNGGLADNMDEDVAIIIGENGMSEAIEQASALYADSPSLVAKRKKAMHKDFSWATRKRGYMEVYEA